MKRKLWSSTTRVFLTAGMLNRQNRRLRLECLESRIALATTYFFTFTGLVAGGSWSAPGNWNVSPVTAFMPKIPVDTSSLVKIPADMITVDDIPPAKQWDFTPPLPIQILQPLTIAGLNVGPNSSVDFKQSLNIVPFATTIKGQMGGVIVNGG